MQKTILSPSRFGHKVQMFLACDDGSRICWGCAQPADDCRLNEYGPVRSFGYCCNCGFEVALQMDKREERSIREMGY